MDFKSVFVPGKSTTMQTVNGILQCNELTLKFGLSLSEKQITELLEKRKEALQSAGRVEFGEGVLKKLILEFCDSPYISQGNYAETLGELQELFYYFKNESLELFSDDELLRFMKDSFDGECEGSLDFLRETSLEDVCRKIRFGVDY